MPTAAVWTPLVADQRCGWPTAGTLRAADATFESGYCVRNAASRTFLFSTGYTITLADGDSTYATVEGNFTAVAWAPGANENLLQVGVVGALTVGNPCLGITRDSAGNVTAFLYDAGGNYHRTGTWAPTASTYYVLGARCTWHYTGIVTTVDVELVTIDRSSPNVVTSQALLSGDVVLTSPATIAFARQCQVGLSTAFGKAGTGEFDCGVVKINVSSGVTLSPTGSAWTQAAVDQIKTAQRVALDVGTTQTIYDVGLITVYSNAADGDSWPTTFGGSSNGIVVDWRLPTSDYTPLQWTPDSGSTHYTQVDDPLGSWSTTSNVSSAPHTQFNEDQYGYGSLSLSGKTVLAVGISLDNGTSAGGYDMALNVNGTLTARVAGANVGGVAPMAYWDKVTVGSGFPATGQRNRGAVV